MDGPCLNESRCSLDLLPNNIKFHDDYIDYWYTNLCTSNAFIYKFMGETMLSNYMYINATYAYLTTCMNWKQKPWQKIKYK